MLLSSMDSNNYKKLETKAEQQLGIKPRTARHQLNRDITYHLLLETGRNYCLRCSTPLTKDNWSVEHVKDWLDSENPIDTFFDIKNIAFVCKICNSTYNRGRVDVRKTGIALEKPIKYKQLVLGSNPVLIFLNVIRSWLNEP